ncbi:MAG: cysC [Chlamydiales bacterium]|jgi:adenylylsulfate kinase-like enzyme|nr:cysC [Chlamydiales bacterium]
MAFLLWITGLAGAGKTTIAKEVFKRILPNHPNTVFLDGDSFREIIGNPYGYDSQGRFDNAKALARLCHYLTAQNINVVCATISLFHEIHALNRQFVAQYYEVYIKVPLDVLNQRNQKGLYSGSPLADSGVVGISQNYEAPLTPHLILNNDIDEKIEANVLRILELIQEG